MIFEFAAWRKIAVRRVTGAMPLLIRLRSTSPAPTDGSWSTSPTNNTCVPGRTRLEQMVHQHQIQHGNFVHHQKVEFEWIFIVVFEAIQRGIFQQAMNGAGRVSRGFRKPFCRPSSWRSQCETFMLSRQCSDQGFQAGGFASSGPPVRMLIG